jgi:hypothetical protein
MAGGFKPASRDWSMAKMPRKAAVTYTEGMFIYNDETDNVPVTTTTQNNVIGIVQKSYDSSTSTADMYVLIPNSPNSTFFGEEAAGTFTKAMEGDQFDFDSTGLYIDQATSTYDTVTMVKFISSTKGIFRLNTLYGKD